MENYPDPKFLHIVEQLDEGPIGSNKKCCVALQAVGRVAYILPHNGNLENLKILPGGWFSRNLYSELGWHTDEVVDELWKFIHPDDRHWLTEPNKGSLSSQVRIRLARADASYVWVLAEGVVTASQMIGSFRVITGNIRGFNSDSGHPPSIEK